MKSFTKTEVLTIGEADESTGEPIGRAFLTTLMIEGGNAGLRGYALDQYEVDAFTMWVNEVMERHANDE